MTRPDFANITSSQAPQGVTYPVQGGPVTAPMMPMVVQQPYQQPYQPQPVMIHGGPAPVGPSIVGGGQPVFVQGGQPQTMVPGNSQPPVHIDPVTGIGMTSGEVAAGYLQNPELNEPQDFKPKDDNPSRMYYVRQLDGQYIQMPRITIDSFGDGARWFVTDQGVFYAVRQPD